MNARGALFFVALVAAGCAQIINADFDGLGPKESTGGAAGTGATDGSPYRMPAWPLRRDWVPP